MTHQLMVIHCHRNQGLESELRCAFICSLSAADPETCDVNPDGATAPYATRELLRSLQLQFEGATPEHPGVLINGPSADWWATGIVLYEVYVSSIQMVCGFAYPLCMYTHCMYHHSNSEQD